ncbi:hypothetical protein H4W01_001588 [Sphingomonas sp. PL20]
MAIATDVAALVNDDDVVIRLRERAPDYGPAESGPDNAKFHR